MKEVIRLNDNARVVVEVLDNGSIVVTLEQRIGRNVMLDRTWQPVNFKRFGTRNGYKISPPGAISKLFGDTLEKRIRKAVSRCRSRAIKLASIHQAISQIVPPPTSEDASSIEDLIHIMARDLHRRLSRALPERGHTLSHEQREHLNIIFMGAIDNIVQAVEGMPLIGVSVVDIRNAPEDVRQIFGEMMRDVIGIDRSVPSTQPQPIPQPEGTENQSSPDTRRERIDDIIHGAIEDDETEDPNS